jgi:hypothetical protein
MKNFAALAKAKMMALLNHDAKKQRHTRKEGFDSGYWAARARKATGLRTYRIVGEDHSPARVELTRRLPKLSGRRASETRSMIWGCA